MAHTDATEHITSAHSLVVKVAVTGSSQRILQDIISAMTKADSLLNADLCMRAAVKVLVKKSAMMDGDKCRSGVPVLSV